MARQTWKCPACSNTVTTFTAVTWPPTCGRHTNGGRLMVEVDKPPPKARKSKGAVQP